jgi:hypothetical protein
MEVADAILPVFLGSLHPFYDNCWYTFQEFLASQRDLSRRKLFLALEHAIGPAVSLIEPPYREVIRAYCVKEPTEQYHPFILNLLVYKPGKLHLLYSPLFAGHADRRDLILRELKLVKKPPLGPIALSIIPLLIATRPVVFTTPSLVDSAHIDPLPMVLTEYDVNAWGRVTLSDEQYAGLLSDCEQDIGRLRATVFQPLYLQCYSHRHHFGRPSDCVILPEAQFTFEKRFFSASEILQFEAEWLRLRNGCCKRAMPPNFELFCRYKEAEELSASVRQMNSVFDLISQRLVMKEYQASLRRYDAMVLARFFGRMPKSRNSVPDGLVYFSGMKCDAEFFFYPFLAELLNRVPASFGNFVTREMKKRFATLMKERKPDAALDSVRGAKLFRASVRMLQFEASAMVGQRFLLLWEVLRRVEVLMQRFLPEQPLKMALIAGLIAASENVALLETLLYFDQVFFATPFTSVLLHPSLNERWCVLTQGLWLIVADDPILTGQCRDALFT